MKLSNCKLCGSDAMKKGTLAWCRKAGCPQGTGYYSHEEWERLNGEPDNWPDWSNAPEWANCAIETCRGERWFSEVVYATGYKFVSGRTATKVHRRPG